MMTDEEFEVAANRGSYKVTRVFKYLIGAATVLTIAWPSWLLLLQVMGWLQTAKWTPLYLGYTVLSETGRARYPELATYFSYIPAIGNLPSLITQAEPGDALGLVKIGNWIATTPLTAWLFAFAAMFYASFVQISTELAAIPKPD